MDCADASDYIADSVDAFLTDIGSDIKNTNEPMHLGFTFRFVSSTPFFAHASQLQFPSRADRYRRGQAVDVD